jgi:hypothetical protein
MITSYVSSSNETIKINPLKLAAGILFFILALTVASLMEA